MGKFYITTPIYYVNDVPHVGHAYTTTVADVAARFHRQLGDDVFYLTGTDEHGTKVEQAAAARGLSPKAHADEMVVKFKEVARKVGASNDFFIRTTDPEHEAFVQQFVQRCYDAGDIYKSSYSGLYCPACEAYYTEDNLVDGLCPDHGIAPVTMEEENYFFRLSAYQGRLTELYKGHPDFVRPRHRYNEALSFIEQGLDDISVSRATLKWGITVPWDPAQVIYVWVDALINYLSALHYAPGQDLVSRFWPANYHVMAQDILKFHGIIWPALLMSAGYELPEHLFVHGYLKLGGEKMSKTRGNVMDPFPLIEQYGADPFRFYCLREVSFGRQRGRLQISLQQRVGERAGQPAVADHVDDRQVPGRLGALAAPGPHTGRLAVGDGGGRDCHHRACATGGHGPERGAGDDLGVRAPSQPVRRGAGAVEAGQGGGRRRRRRGCGRRCARRHALGPGRGAALALRVAAPVHPGHERRHPRTAGAGS